MNPTIELPVAELKTALTGLGKVIPKSHSLPVLQSVRLTRDAKGLVTLQATDLNATVIYQTAASPGPACDFLTPFDPLAKAVKNSQGNVGLIRESKTQVRLKTFLGATPIEQTFETPPVDEFPPTPKVEGKGFPVDAVFRDTLRQALDCCGTDWSRTAIQNVCLDVSRPRAHYLVATDGHHLYCANSFAFDFKRSVLIPDQRFLRWSGFMADGPGELTVQPKSRKQDPWLQLKAGPWTFLAKQADDVFPNWSNALPEPKRTKTIIRLDAKAAETLLSVLPQLPGHGDNNQPVQFVVNGESFMVRGQNRAGGEWSEVPVEDAATNGRSMTVMLNRAYVLKALRFGLHTVEIGEALDKIEFHTGNRRLIVMPLNSNPPPRAARPSHPNNPPPSSSPEAQPEERKPMPRTSNPAPALPAPAPREATAPEPPTALKAALQQLDTLKDTVKSVLRELQETADRLKQAEREQKAGEREVQAVRATLRSLQKVEL